MSTSESRHRVVAVPSDRQHVTVRIGGRVVADSRRPVLVHETGYPVRYYLPPQDVDLSRFEPTTTHTTCPFKGAASYWTYVGDGAGDILPDAAWTYPDPKPDVAPIRGHLAFYDTVAEIEVEGDAPPSPDV